MTETFRAVALKGDLPLQAQFFLNGLTVFPLSTDTYVMQMGVEPIAEILLSQFKSVPVALRGSLLFASVYDAMRFNLQVSDLRIFMHLSISAQALTVNRLPKRHNKNPGKKPSIFPKPLSLSFIWLSFQDRTTKVGPVHRTWSRPVSDR